MKLDLRFHYTKVIIVYYHSQSILEFNSFLNIPLCFQREYLSIHNISPAYSSRPHQKMAKNDLKCPPNSFQQVKSNFSWGLCSTDHFISPSKFNQNGVIFTKKAKFIKHLKFFTKKKIFAKPKVTPNKGVSCAAQLPLAAGAVYFVNTNSWCCQIGK